MVKENKDGVIKARACVDGHKQRRYISKEEVVSPTIQLESLIIFLLIDAREGRDVATVDVVGAYFLATMNDYVLLKLTGDTVNMMCQINPKYLSYGTQEGGKQVLYIRLKKVLMVVHNQLYYNILLLEIVYNILISILILMIHV